MNFKNVKYLAQFIILFSIMIIWLHISKIFINLGLAIVIWYSWKTILVLKKQEKANIYNYYFGLLSSIIGIVLILISFIDVTILSIIPIILGISILVFVYLTLSFHK